MTDDPRPFRGLPGHELLARIDELEMSWIWTRYRSRQYRPAPPELAALRAEYIRRTKDERKACHTGL